MIVEVEDFLKTNNNNKKQQNSGLSVDILLLKCSFWFKKKFDTFCCDGINPAAPGPSFPSSKK